MKSVTNIRELPIADAWSNPGANLSPEQAIEPNANRLAFADPEFLLRRETRGIRFQLEMLKPDLIQEAHHIDSTVVVFGSARFKSHEEAASALDHAYKRRHVEPARSKQKMAHVHRCIHQR